MNSTEVRSLMSQLTEAHINAALLRVDQGDTGNFSESTKYDLVHEGRRYPPKRVVGMALEALTGVEFSPRDFKGGELSDCFRALQRLGYAIHDKANAVKPIVYAPEQTARRWKYGKASWQLVLGAVESLGGSATRQAVKDYLTATAPTFNVANVDPDMSMLSVNSFSRGSYSPNDKPRRTDEGSPFDALYIERREGDAIYHLYQPSLHGVWELQLPPGDDRLRPRLLAPRILEELEQRREEEEHRGTFDPSSVEDARKRVLASIVVRQGQGRFRSRLLEAYGSRCAITDCDSEDALEAAHICGYRGEHTNVVPNGLLLRADIHTLFDLGLLAVDCATMTIRVASKLKETVYARLDGTSIRLPVREADQPDRAALQEHWNRSIASQVMA